MNKVTFNEIISNWLRDEWHYDVYEKYRKDKNISKIVMHPNLKNIKENILRFKILSKDRNTILKKIPHNTLWYKTKIGSRIFKNVYLIRTKWCKVITKNTYRLQDIDLNLFKKIDPVHKERVSSILKSKKVSLSKTILFGSDKNKPLTVIEGNHRIIANYISFKRRKKFICNYTYIGISSSASKSKLLSESFAQK